MMWVLGVFGASTFAIVAAVLAYAMQAYTRKYARIRAMMRVRA